MRRETGGYLARPDPSCLADVLKITLDKGMRSTPLLGFVGRYRTVDNRRNDRGGRGRTPLRTHSLDQSPFGRSPDGLGGIGRQVAGSGRLGRADGASALECGLLLLHAVAVATPSRVRSLSRAGRPGRPTRPSHWGKVAVAGDARRATRPRGPAWRSGELIA